MKKPFLSLKTKKEKAKFLLLLCLSLCAITLFFLPPEATQTIGGAGYKTKSLYGYFGSLL